MIGFNFVVLILSKGLGDGQGHKSVSKSSFRRQSKRTSMTSASSSARLKFSLNSSVVSTQMDMQSFPLFTGRILEVHDNAAGGDNTDHHADCGRYDNGRVSALFY